MASQGSFLSQMMATCLAEMISGADTNVTTPESRVEYSQPVLLRTSNANQLSGLGSTVSQTSHQSLLNQLQAGGGLAAPMAPNASFFQYYIHILPRDLHMGHMTILNQGLRYDTCMFQSPHNITITIGSRERHWLDSL